MFVVLFERFMFEKVVILIMVVLSKGYCVCLIIKLVDFLVVELVVMCSIIFLVIMIVLFISIFMVIIMVLSDIFWSWIFISYMIRIVFSMVIRSIELIIMFECYFMNKYSVKVIIVIDIMRLLIKLVIDLLMIEVWL